MSIVQFVADIGLSVFIIFSGLLGYIPQYKKIRKGDGQGFSTLICFILIVCNVLRLFFWVGKRFNMELVWQSVAMIICQFVILEAHVTQSTVKRPVRRPRTFQDFDISQFWAWDDFNSYLTFILSLGLVMAVLTVIFTFSTWYFEIVGAIALTIEASLGMPQALKNFKQKSTEGLSNILIISWLFGDIGKCLYFWYISAPFQFMACGLFQISMDLFILGQIMFYLRTSGGVDKPKV